MDKILVIDDSETNTILIKSIFEDEDSNSEIIIVNNSKEAVSKAITTMPSLILLDLMMPGINGEDILKELKQRDETKHIPVIVVSAKQEEEDIKHVLQLGALVYIKKPISIYNLYKRVREITKQ